MISTALNVTDTGVILVDGQYGVEVGTQNIFRTFIIAGGLGGYVYYIKHQNGSIANKKEASK